MCFLFVSSLVWFFLWLPEEELTLPFLFHRENGDFSILMKDIFPVTLVDVLTPSRDQLGSSRFIFWGALGPSSYLLRLVFF